MEYDVDIVEKVIKQMSDLELEKKKEELKNEEDDNKWK